MSDKPRVGAGIGIMVFRNNKILLGKRHDDPEKASSALHGEGTWTMPGGKLDFGETFEKGATREVFEETSIKVNSLKVVCISNEIVSDAHFVTIGLLCEDFEGEPKVMEPEEITEWKWFDLNNLPKPMFFPCVKIINNFLEGKFYKY